MSVKKRVHAFIAGQNLFHSAKDSFGYMVVNYDPFKIAEAVTNLEPDRILAGLNFYTGVDIRRIRPQLHDFWRTKLHAIRREGERLKIDTRVIRRPLKYIEIPDYKKPGGTYYKGREKGIDVRLALDIVRLARRGEYDVAIIFSQDSDLNEAVNEVRALSKELGLNIKLECAFPQPPPGKRTFGLQNTKWRIIEKQLYDSCRDPNTSRYFPKPPMFSQASFL